MKFSIIRNGQVGLLLTLSVLTISCNPDEFFPIEELLTGEDAFCYEAKDLESCQQRVDRCQPSFVEGANESVAPEFVLCLANPEVENGYEGNPNDSSDQPSGPENQPTDETTDPNAPTAAPTLKEAYDAKCENLDAKYLWVKKEVKKKKVVQTTSKVKVCHSTGNGSSHTIVIACPALKAHIKHKDSKDYLGACSI